MLKIIQKSSFLAALLVMAAMLFTAVPQSLANSQYKRPSKTKNMAVGTAIGAVGGALLGGGKGALLGAGAGAGAGYLVYRHKKHKHQKRYYRYAR